eukprot:TRINITY_DN8844_c0_g1_i1.p1 TRINITY_DN8844_c0_g1~~TRINITY_DN8844_c0_g1_i1.p1  ORF type:complete len:481 (+),score=131.39 TRINITY_DN8844_c0_g1_i1:34-1476(+)
MRLCRALRVIPSITRVPQRLFASKSLLAPSQYLPLKDADPEVFNLLKREQKRQAEGLELIASENFTSKAVLEAIGSVFTNKYSEGLPGARYYGGNEVIDELERLCIKRALKAFNLDSAKWGVNVQPYSGSTANFAAFLAVLQPHDRLMGLDLTNGGHLTHGFYNAKKKVSASAMVFESLPYKVNSKTGLVDYDALETNALLFRPKLIICGASAYPREWDYARLRKIADKVEALLLCDMAHISGLVASKVVGNPFDYCHVVTTTTHKTLRGPRAGLIFFRKDDKMKLEEKVNNAVFPAVQGGPHNNTIAGIAVQLKEVASAEFHQYAKQIKLNCATLAEELMNKGHKLISNGTDNHLILWDVKHSVGISGGKVESTCDCCSLTVNKNTLFFDTSAFNPSGVRVGVAALTSRGLKEKDFVQVAGFLDRASRIAARIDKENKSPKMVEFKSILKKGDSELAALRDEIVKFSTSFPMPGQDLDD